MMCTCACIQFIAQCIACTLLCANGRRRTHIPFERERERKHLANFSQHSQNTEWMERTTSSALIRFALVPNARTQGDRLHECNHNQKQNKCLVDIYGRTKFIYPIDFNCRIHWRALTLTYTSSNSVVVGPFLCVQQAACRQQIQQWASGTHSTYTRKIGFGVFSGCWLVTYWMVFGISPSGAWTIP